MVAKMRPEASQKSIKKRNQKIPRTISDLGSQNGSKRDGFSWTISRFWQLFRWVRIQASFGRDLEPKWSQLGTKNLPKNVPEPFQKLVIFLIGCGVGFGYHVVPPWFLFGRQKTPKNRPKIQTTQQSTNQTQHQNTTQHSITLLDSGGELPYWSPLPSTPGLGAN